MPVRRIVMTVAAALQVAAGVGLVELARQMGGLALGPRPALRLVPGAAQAGGILMLAAVAVAVVGLLLILLAWKLLRGRGWARPMSIGALGVAVLPGCLAGPLPALAIFGAGGLLVAVSLCRR